MHGCCVVGCQSKSGKLSYPTTFHMFPSIENPNVRKGWINAVGRVNWEPALSSRMCSKHFTVEDFDIMKSVKKLKIHAVPSLNLGLGGTAKMTAKACVVPTCSARHSEAPFFNFPKDKSLCLKWLLAIPKGGWSLNQESQVCSRHFDRGDYVENNGQAWLKSGSVPKLYLENPTLLSRDSLLPISKTEVTLGKPTELNLNAGKDDGEPGSSEIPEDSTESSSPKSDQVKEKDDVCKIKLDIDDGSESDLEIIEPEIETYEVSDTSDEGEPPPKPTAAPKLVTVTRQPPLQTSLNCKLQINEIRSSTTPRPNVIVKPPGSCNGRVIRGDNRIKCCVPRCGSVAGTPPGVGFHSFPQVGETRLSVRSLDNKLTVHDLFSMWKSLLSVHTINDDSYVCTRHFTPNDYTGNVLNKVAVPTQFLPTPVTFAPCKVQEKGPAQPPPLVLLNKSKNPPPILRKPAKAGFNSGTTSIRFPGIPSVNNVNSLARVATNRLATNRQATTSRIEAVPTKIFHQLQQTKSLPTKLQNIAPKCSTLPLTIVAKRLKLGCSITNCPNQHTDDETKVIMFRLPHNIDKCKEWVYSCGHPEWLDKGMATARSIYRICWLHFEDEMFLDDSHKNLKGSAKPTVAVQEPYKKCIVKHCNNYYDKDRLHYIGVDFATFPTASNLFNSWVKAIKTGDPSKSTELTQDDVENFTGAVVCSLHFRNSDYVAGATGKTLSPAAIPSMNLIYVKEPEVPTLLTEETNEPSQPEPTESTSSRRGRGAKSRPFMGRGRRRQKGRRPGWMKYDLSHRIKEGGSNETDKSIAVEGGTNQYNLPTSDVQPQVRRTWQRGRKRGSRLSVISRMDGGSDEANTPTSSKVETLYGPSGRPIRSAVLKRKTIVESNSESENSDDEPLAKKWGRMTKESSSSEDYSDACEKRTLRPRRSVTSKNVAVVNSDSERDSQDSEWKEEAECEPMDYGGSVAENGHFLDSVLNVETNQTQPAEETSWSPAADTSEQPSEQTSHSPAADTFEQPSEPTSRSPAADTSVQPAEQTFQSSAADTSEQPSEPTSRSPAPDTSEQPSEDNPEGPETETTKLNEDNQQDVTMSSDVEGMSDAVIEDSTNQSPDTAAITNEDEGPGTKVDSELEVNSLDNMPESSDPDPVREVDSSSIGGNPITTDNTKEDQMETSDIPAAADISVEPEKVNGKDIDDPDDQFDDNENLVAFGPKLPIPTLADMEFFRSILPAVASFNHVQKSELRSAIVATLRELLNEHLETNPETKELMKTESPIEPSGI